MILDAYGREMRRAIGFSGGLRITHVPKHLVDRVAGATVDLEETYEPIEECDLKVTKEPDGLSQ